MRKRNHGAGWTDSLLQKRPENPIPASDQMLHSITINLETTGLTRNSIA